MTIGERLAAFEKLGDYIGAIDEVEFAELMQKVRNENPWFTPGSVNVAFEGVRRYLDGQKLRAWVSGYSLNPETTKTIAVVMAGNIPLAGFLDFLSVLISGHNVMAKLSSKDSVLLTHLSQKLIAIEPRFDSLITIPAQLRNFDAVIATGSDNSSRYFQYYFGKYPHIIRKNRTSCAVLTGSEGAEELMLLGRDVFTYFGLGCRNVSKIYIPEDFDPARLVIAWDIYVDIIHHHKYHNNYHYQKSILLVSSIPFLDNGFVLLQESERLVSPIAVIYYEYYDSGEELDIRLKSISEKLQCIVGDSAPASVKFGDTQFPTLTDYADNVDTLKFLAELA